MEAAGVFNTEVMQHIQRRVEHNIITPRAYAPQCIIMDTENGTVHLLRVCDISAVEICLEHRNYTTSLTPGRHYRNCRLLLPGVGAIKADITLNHAAEVQRGNGKYCLQYGASLKGISPADSAVLQRYIHFIRCNFSANNQVEA